MLLFPRNCELLFPKTARRFTLAWYQADILGTISAKVQPVSEEDKQKEYESLANGRVMCLLPVQLPIWMQNIHFNCHRLVK